MNTLMKLVLLAGVCAFYMARPAAADPLEDGKNAYAVGNYAKAREILTPLAMRGVVEAEARLGALCLEQQDYTAAFKWLSYAAEQGNATAQQKLGVMYDGGLGVAQDYPAALKWFRFSADQGNAFAQRNLAVAYSEGRGVPQDYVTALMWENISASNAMQADSSEETALVDQPNSLAMRMSQKQIIKARRLYQQCASNGFKGC